MGRDAKGRARRQLVALGWACGVAQAVLLREGMALAGGSEMAWGVVLAVWLAGMSLGARLGVWLGRPTSGEWGPAALVVVAFGATVLLRAAPALTGTLAGEVMATWRAAWLWAAAVLPVAALGGWSFPTLTAALGGPAGRAWALEAAGAFLGGTVFTFVLAGVGSGAALGVALAAAVLLAPPRGSRWAAVVGVAIAVGMALPLTDGALARAGWRWAGHPGELAAWTNTRQQRLELGAGPPPAIYGDGALIAVEPDPYATAPVGHLLALLHPEPRVMLCVGCLGVGVLPALLRHPVERVVVVEDDPQLARRLPRWLGGELAKALGDARVELPGDDPVRVLQRAQVFDLILLLDQDPLTLRHHRTRSQEFLSSCAARLAPGGVLAMRTGVADTYLAGFGGGLLATLAATLKAVFPAVAALPGERVILVAGMEESGLVPGLEDLTRRWWQRGGGDPAFDPMLLGAQLDPQRLASLAAFVAAASAPPSTARHPRAVLLATLHAEARGGSRAAGPVTAVLGMPSRWALVAVLALALLPLLWALAKGGPASPLAACVGFSSMGWWLLLLGAWQAAEGSVYAEVGVLSGLFMAGMAAAAWGVARGREPLPWLGGALAGGVVLSLALAGAVPLLWPRTTIVPLLVGAGACTGAAFPGLAELAGGGNQRRGAGRSFAADELGAAIGALVLGTVALPWLGLPGAGTALAVIMAAALGSLLVGRRRRAGG